MPSRDTPRSFAGSCHCGAIEFSFATELSPEKWSVRACNCSFCSAHGARYTSDPCGEVRFSCADASNVGRYRFGQRTADFVHCLSCGSFLGAIMKSDRGTFSVINLNVFRAAPEALPAPQRISLSHESAHERGARRETRWTPTVSDL